MSVAVRSASDGGNPPPGDCLHRYGVPLGQPVSRYIYGFALQETSLPVATDEESDAFAEQMLEVMGQAYPHLAELTRVRVLDPKYRFGMEFEFGLDLILDRLEEMHAAEVEAR